MTTTPADYIRDHGLDFTAIEAIAAKGLSEADEDFCAECGLDPSDLHAYCLAEVKSACLDCGKTGETKTQPYRGVQLCAECYEIDMQPSAE